MTDNRVEVRPGEFLPVVAQRAADLARIVDYVEFSFNETTVQVSRGESANDIMDRYFRMRGDAAYFDHGTVVMEVGR